MNVAEKEEKIIKLNDERRNLIREAKRLNNNDEGELTNMLRAVEISKRLFEIDLKMEELTKSGQVNRS